MALSDSEIAALLAGPAMPAPEGVTPDFTNPPHDNGIAWFVITFTLVVSTICVLIRAFDKCYLSRQWRTEEVLILGAYGCFIGQAYAAYALMYAPGYMVHQYNLTYADIIEPSYLFLVFGNFYSLILPALKVAILTEWCRIFVNGNRTRNPFWWACVGIGVLQVVWGVVCVLLLNFQCIPHEKIWKFYLEGTCIGLHEIQLASASIQVFSDLAMTVLPQKLIWNLHMGWRKRLGVSIIFGFGLLASLSAVVRLYVTITFGLAIDQMYYFGPVAFWCIIEGACGFFIICVPCMPKIIKETRFGRKIRAALGIKRTTATPSTGAHTLNNNTNTNGTNLTWGRKSTRSGAPGGGKHKYSAWGTTAEAYYEIEEGAVGLESIKRSGSGKSVRHGAGREASPGSEESAGVMVTTETCVTVVSKDSRSLSSGGSGLGEMRVPLE